MKQRQNHREYLKVLQTMTPAQRARIAFELSERNKRLSKHALRKRLPDMPDDELHQLFIVG